MIRDRNRDKDHFLSYIHVLEKSHHDRVKKLELGLIKLDRVIPVKQVMVANLIQKMVAMYSLGSPPGELSQDFATIVQLIEESWLEGKRKLIGPKSIVLDQYIIDAHTQILKLLSVGLLLNMEYDLFQRLANLIAVDNVIDLVFEFILSSKLDTWEVRQEKEVYSLEFYQNLKKAIREPNNKEAEKLVEIYLEEDWLREQHKAQILIDPNKESYAGRWSFESAAIVVIKDLDDSSFRNNEYYPKDLVDFYRSE